MIPRATRSSCGNRPLTAERAWHGAVALLAAIGIALEYTTTIAHHPDAPVAATLNFLSYFTILTNALVMLASLGAAIGGGRLHRWTASTGMSAAISLHITVVAVIFQILLAHLVHLSPLGWWGNLLVHRVVPALWLVGWVFLAPHGEIGRMAPLRWLIYPLVYGGWTLVHGAASGWYPYPFVDVARLGGFVVARNMLLMALFFAALGYLYRAMDGLLARRRSAGIAPVA